MEAARTDGAASFVPSLLVSTKRLPLPGRIREATPLLGATVTLVSPLRLENATPYAVHYSLR